MKQNIAATVRALVEPSMTEMGYSVWDVTFYKEGQEQILEVELENDDVFSIEDCQKASHVINPILDEADPIEQAYSLIVSGAGLTRVLRSDEHIDRAVKEGWNTELKLFAAVNGTKELAGVLTAFDKDTVTVGETKIERKMISKMTSILE
ncbi:MAG: ribosome maturation factor RimP [Clostridia bacterium]|nr:ribosome maturation factor RimP [Clostridia bacterium]